jgi:deoxyribodipyrimidine photolyase-related protein
MNAILIWGSQLTIEHHSALQEAPGAPVIMIESRAICASRPYHKQKLRFILTAMREYADELRDSGRIVWYSSMEHASMDWFDELSIICKKHKVTELIAMRQNDRPPQHKLETWCKGQAIALHITPNTMFLTPMVLFHDWAEDQSRLQLEQFYRWQRRRLNILMEGTKPIGGKWNYDIENRKPLPKKVKLPTIAFPRSSRHTADIEQLIATYFSDHPGSMEINWLPTTRAASKQWLHTFIKTRFAHFGAYEDSMLKGETFLYHSALSALLNIGLLHPTEVVAATERASGIPLAGKEGFIRQLIGWREFMFGLYHYKPLDWKDSNFLQQTGTLPEWWWQLNDAPEPPLQDAIHRLDRYGYSHHIERLMVFGNYMLLADYRPQAVYDWFMAMYVDAYEWVMVPNVIGMSQFADGGIDNGSFASKPYISGSNYLQKMGRWWLTQTDAKQSSWTNMYWQFLERHQDTLRGNFRLRPLLARFEKSKKDS